MTATFRVYIDWMYIDNFRYCNFYSSESYVYQRICAIFRKPVVWNHMEFIPYITGTYTRVKRTVMKIDIEWNWAIVYDRHNMYYSI